jgi:hypothetical protein
MPRLTKAFRLDAEHRYWLGDQRLPGVTDVIGDLVDYSRVDPVVLEHKRQIGEALHKAIALGPDLEPASLDPVIEPYYAGWVAFLRENAYEPIEFEQRGYHRVHLFGGTWDQTGRFNGDLGLIDIKTLAVETPVTALQTAAYAAIRDQGRTKIKRRFSLQLKPDGRYVLHEYNRSTDWKVFLACLSRHQWRARNELT